jgi:hypothetical protein
VRAARPLLDQHQWDAYFALFARDVSLPWLPATVRLDTYSGAPVDFAAYNVDPADVIIAGQNRTPRALDTAHLRPLVRWRFSPPPGYRFESNDVAVPLGSREGFYVVEARRGDAVQQVWLNRTHVGLVTKESPEGLLVWGVDLRGGRAIANMPIAFLVGLRLVTKATDRQGLIVWRDSRRPSFALAESGAGRAFVSLLPQAPPPPAIVGLRLGSALVRAGESVRFVGFARRRTPAGYRRASGDARVRLVARGTTLAESAAHLDPAGAFSGALTAPAGLEDGDYSVLASAAGGVGGTAVHVDAAADLALTLGSDCPCNPDGAIPVVLTARRAETGVPDVPVHVQIVRTPHIVPPGSAEDAPLWGTTTVYEQTVRTDAAGRATVTLSPPADGLDSTYGVRATTRGATATARIAVPMAKVALALEPAAPSADVGRPIAFDVRGFDPVAGAPAAGLAVTLRISHGVSGQAQTLTLDESGRAHAIFRAPYLGSNLALAEAAAGGRRALDATSVVVEPSALSERAASTRADVTVAVDKPRYRPGDRVTVRANANGATGDALIALEGMRTYQARLASVAGGRAATTLDLGDAQGDVEATVAFVRDGAVALGSAAVHVQGPGRERETELVLERAAYAPGETLRATIRDGALRGPATLAIRIADGRESGPAFFDDAPEVLLTGATTSQDPASDDPAWHAYVAPARSKASDIFAAERPRKVPTEPPAIGVAAPRTLLWDVRRAADEAFEVVVPKEPGHYVLSLLKISDDGDVGSASATFDVK